MNRHTTSGPETLGTLSFMRTMDCGEVWRAGEWDVKDCCLCCHESCDDEHHMTTAFVGRDASGARVFLEVCCALSKLALPAHVKQRLLEPPARGFLPGGPPSR